MWFKKDSDDVRKPDRESALPTRQKDPDFIQLSTLQLLKILIVEKFLMRKQDTYSFDHGDRGSLMVDPPPAPPTEDKIYHLALVVDNEVKDIMRTQERLASLLTSNPTFVAFDPETDHVHIHSIYENDEFVLPENQERFNHTSQSFDVNDYITEKDEEL